MREGVEEKKREEIVLVSVATLASSLYVTRATAVCKPACLQSKEEVRALGKCSHICT